MSLSDNTRVIRFSVQTELDAQNHDYDAKTSIFLYLAQQEVAAITEASWVSQNAGESLFRQQAGSSDIAEAPEVTVVEHPTNVPEVVRRKTTGRIKYYTEITRFTHLAGGLRPKAWFAFKKRFV